MPFLLTRTTTFKEFAGRYKDTQTKLKLDSFRALVNEALEISFFMTRIQDEDCTEIEEVDMKQWAR